MHEDKPRVKCEMLDGQVLCDDEIPEGTRMILRGHISYRTPIGCPRGTFLYREAPLQEQETSSSCIRSMRAEGDRDDL